MRVALDVSAVPARPAGAGRYIIELARRLGERDVDLELVSRRGDAERWSTISPGARVVPVVPDRRAVRLAYEAVALGRGRSARGIDVWHGPHYTMPRRTRLPVVVTVHDMTYFTHPQYHERTKVAVFTRAIAYAAEHAAAIVTVSEFTARQLRERFEVRGPVVVAPHGVDLERFRPPQPGARPSTAPARFVLFVGTLEPRKGVDVLLDAFARLAVADDEVELVLVGQTGWGVEATETALATHPFAGRIRRLGYVDDAALVDLLGAADVVCYPSRGEGFGLPALEAMACGAPIVTSRDSPMEEFVGDLGWLCEPGDAESLAAALAAAIALSPGERAQRAAASRARAGGYTWERTIERHLEAYGLALHSSRTWRPGERQ